MTSDIKNSDPWAGFFGMLWHSGPHPGQEIERTAMKALRVIFVNHFIESATVYWSHWQPGELLGNVVTLHNEAKPHVFQALADFMMQYGLEKVDIAWRRWPLEGGALGTQTVGA